MTAPAAAHGKDLGVADGLIHAAPDGHEGTSRLPLPAELRRRAPWVSEIVTFPLETEPSRVARKDGRRALDGGGVAAYQAVDASRLFTGLEPDPERMPRHLASR